METVYDRTIVNKKYYPVDTFTYHNVLKKSLYRFKSLTIRLC